MSKDDLCIAIAPINLTSPEAWSDMNECRYEIGYRFRPAFRSILDYFEVRGYDAEKDMVLTTVYPKDGSPFEDSIEQVYLDGALINGDYIPMENNHIPGETVSSIQNRK